MNRSPTISPERMSITPLSRFRLSCFIGWIVLLVSACRPSVLQATIPVSAPAQPSTQPAAADIRLDQPFDLTVGQAVTLSQTDLHLRFERILQDSRCPRMVACVWSGEARLALSLWVADSPPQTKEFSTFSNPPNATDTHLFQGFSIRLVTVNPYPESPDNPIPKGDYSITLVVTKASNSSD